MGAGRPRCHGERGLLRGLAVGGLDVAVLHHAVDHPVAPLDGAVALAERVQVGRRLGQRRQIRDLGYVQFVHRLVEIDERSGGDTVGAETEIDFVQVELEDLVLVVGALDAHGEQRLLDLARVGGLGADEEVLRHLLRDGGGALRPALAVIFEVGDGGAQDAGEIDAAVLVEILVLGRDESVLDELGHRLDRDVEAPLLGVLGDKGAVGSVHARHHRRLIVLQRRVVGQILGEMPDDVGGARRAAHEQDRAGGEQESEKPHQQSHRTA